MVFCGVLLCLFVIFLILGVFGFQDGELMCFEILKMNEEEQYLLYIFKFFEMMCDVCIVIVYQVIVLVLS